ncbi:MAG: hemolysin III family protein [Eubacteriales bacterium]
MVSVKKTFNHKAALRLWSALTHGLGALFALVGTTVLICREAYTGTSLSIAAFAVYGASMICLYTASTLYHSIRASDAWRIALRKYDHCSIYLLIAGSYTPVCILALANTVGYTLFAVIWCCALLGIILTAIRLNIPAWVSAVIYLAMGWLAVVAIVPLWQVMSGPAMACLLLGGVFYTIGGVLYAVKWPCRNNPRFGCHEIFHLFILCGSVCHFIMMFYL